MFIPVIRCEEEDLYFIVVECIQAAFLVSASPSACLFRKHFPPPEARCNPRTEEEERDAFSQLLISLIMVQVLPVIPPEGKLLQSSLKLSENCAGFGWLVVGFLPCYCAHLLV